MSWRSFGLFFSGKKRIASRVFSSLDDVVASLTLPADKKILHISHYHGGVTGDKTIVEFQPTQATKLFLRERLGSQGICHFTHARSETYRGKNGTVYHYLDIQGEAPRGAIRLEVSLEYTTTHG